MEEEDRDKTVFRTVLGEGMLGIQGPFLAFWDPPQIGGSDVHLVGIRITEEEMTEAERENYQIANEFGHRTLSQLKGYMEGGRVCILQTNLKRGE
jgi:hypothetical protein